MIRHPSNEIVVGRYSRSNLPEIERDAGDGEQLNRHPVRLRELRMPIITVRRVPTAQRLACADTTQ